MEIASVTSPPMLEFVDEDEITSLRDVEDLARDLHFFGIKREFVVEFHLIHGLVSRPERLRDLL